MPLRTDAEGTVTVKALGLLAGRLPGGGPVVLPLPDAGRLTAGETMRRAGIPDEEVFMILVNGRRSGPDQALSPGDTVVFVPPVAGG